MHNHFCEADMRYIVGFLIMLGLVILLIILLFSGGSKPKPPTAKTLDTYAGTNAQAILTIDGPINGASLHNQVRITVDRDNVVYEQIKGYDGDVVKMQSFSSTQNAYTSFLFALAHAGFTRGSLDKTLKNESGYCPFGDRYIFEVNQDAKTIERFWATSCGKPKSYLGNVAATLSLFQAQVPGYNDLTGDLDL